MGQVNIKKIINNIQIFLGSKWGLLVKVVLSLGILCYFLMTIDLNKVQQITSNLNFNYLYVILGLILLQNFFFWFTISYTY